MFLKIANLRQLESTTHITFPNITSNNNLNPENKAARLKAKKKRVCMEKIHMRNHKIPRLGIQATGNTSSDEYPLGILPLLIDSPYFHCVSV